MHPYLIQSFVIYRNDLSLPQVIRLISSRLKTGFATKLATRLVTPPIQLAKSHLN